jgi:hypothetical protein
VRLYDGEAPFASLDHLIPRRQVGDWRGALERVRRSLGARIAVTGPWPTYAFAPPVA